MMNLKKRMVRIVSVLAFIFLVGSTPVYSADMMDNFITDHQGDKKQEGAVELEYNEYPLSRYGMDTHLEDETLSDLMPWGWDDNIGKQTNQGVAMINSTLWQLNILFSNFVGTLISSAFEFDIISDFADDITLAIQDIVGFGPNGYSQNGLWPYFLPSIIVIIGTWAGYMGVIKRASSRALGGVLTSIIIMTLSLGFFTNADKILTATNDGISEVQNDILSFTLSAALPGEFSENEGVAVMRNQMFNLMIKYPYLLLEYGTVNENEIESEWKKGGSRIDALLNTNPLSKERKDAIQYEVKELDNNNMKPETLTNRLVILFLSLIMNAIMGIILILLSCSLIGYQIMVLVFAVFMSVALLIGLIPSFAATAQKSVMKLLHALYMKIALTLLISIYFAISKMIYNVMDPQEGYVLLFVMQIVITVLVWVKRAEVLNVISTPFRQANVNNTLGQHIREYKQTYLNGKKHLNNVMKPLVKPAIPLEERASYKLKYNPGVGVVNPMTHPSFKLNERKTDIKPDIKADIKPDKKIDTQKQAEPVKNTLVKRQPITSSEETTKKPLEPKITDPNNLKSLSETSETGDRTPILKDRLAERKNQIRLAERKEPINK